MLVVAPTRAVLDVVWVCEEVGWFLNSVTRRKLA